ncbi:MAG: P-II family nitrogen regulator [Firmicutes bacterium]|nr:P-II family nitrogen regulator [Bacillota bacterium]
MERLYLVIAITDRQRGKKALALFEENNVVTTYTAMGEGTAPPEILDYLYLSPSEKSVIMGIVTESGILSLFKNAKRKLYIDLPGNGIVVSVPLNSVGGRSTLQYFLEGQSVNFYNNEKEESGENMAIKTDYELIIVIANEGYSDLVMDAARTAGAMGGTVIKARGTGAENTEKFMGFSISKEKEIHLLVTPSEDRNLIMKTIMDKAGKTSKAQSMVFSLPVCDAIGLKLPE